MGNNDFQTLSDYYNSPEWAAKRNERLRIDGYKCARCGFTRALEVHHINYNRIFAEDVSRDLITLCKKCHNEIEKQKQWLDPIPNQPEHHTAYLAGKIRKNDWRPCNKWDPDISDFDISERVNDSLTVTGPFFIPCDHGCYHGPESHGVGATNGGCCGDYLTRDDVFRICKSQIDRAEILFAFIDCINCFGTIAEIGYAHAKGKEIIIYFETEHLKEEMWFVDKMQQRNGIATDAWINEQLISLVKNDIYDGEIPF